MRRCALVVLLFLTTSPVCTPQVSDAEVAYWNSISQERNPDLFRAYLKRYPEGQFAEIARAKITSLSTTAAPQTIPASQQRPEAEAMPKTPPLRTEWPVRDGYDLNCIGTLIIDTTGLVFHCDHKGNRAKDNTIPLDTITRYTRDGENINILQGTKTVTSIAADGKDSIEQAKRIHEALETVIFAVIPEREPITVRALHKHGTFTGCTGQLTAKTHSLIFSSSQHTLEWDKRSIEVRMRTIDIGWTVEVTDEHHTKNSFQLNHYVTREPPFRLQWGKPETNGVWEKW